MAAGQWDFWIDRGGTFTDVVARDGQGRLHTMKLLSDKPEAYRDAAIEAIRRCPAPVPGEATAQHDSGGMRRRHRAGRHR